MELVGGVCDTCPRDERPLLLKMPELLIATELLLRNEEQIEAANCLQYNDLHRFCQGQPDRDLDARGAGRDGNGASRITDGR